MKKIIFLFLLFLPLICGFDHLLAQEPLLYLGKHYGDHPTWEYFAQVNTYRKGDTLVYEEKRYNRNVIREENPPIHQHWVKLLLKNDQIITLHDSARYGWGYGFAFYEKEGRISFRPVSSPQVNNIQKGKLPYFSTLESLSLYLRYTDLHLNYEETIAYGVNSTNDAPRPFKVKVIDQLTLLTDENTRIDCYDIAFFSLDSSNVGDARIYLDKQNGVMVKKEYTVHEQSFPRGGLKSIANERLISADYRIDLAHIAFPSAHNFMEAAFSNLQNKEYVPSDAQSALLMMDKALVKKTSYQTIEAKLRMMLFLKQEESTLRTFLNDILGHPDLSVMDVHQVGRWLMDQEQLNLAQTTFEKNAAKHPDHFVPMVGLARFYNAQKNFTEALHYLRKSLTLNPDEGNRGRIQENIQRLEKGEAML